MVAVKTFINPNGRTVDYLGREREGSGIVIDADGLIVTIGYLMVEAHAAQVTTNDGRTVPANVVGYDQTSGFGLLQAISPLKVRPMALGFASSEILGLIPTTHFERFGRLRADVPNRASCQRPFRLSP